MSQAEELLNSMAEEETVAGAAVVDAEPHIVIGTDKFIVVPPELRRIAVQHEHNVKTVTFDCPRYWDGRDLMDMVLRINYKTPDNVVDMKEVENVIVDPDDDTIIHFDWTITRNVTQMNGTLSFLACGVKLDDEGKEDQHWNSELNREMTISEGLECATSILEEYPDVITDILLRLRKLETDGVDITLDESLALAGKAADAKAVGDALDKQKLLEVTLDGSSDAIASHSASEINAHLNNGGSVVLNYTDYSGNSSSGGYAQLWYRSELVVIFCVTDITDSSVSQTLYSIGADKTYGEETFTYTIPDNTGGEVSLIDFSNFENGSFTETVDGEVITHTVTFDDQNRPIAIDNVEIKWGDS